MVLPTSYSEPVLVQFLHDTLGQVADALGLSPGGDDDARGSYGIAVIKTVLAYYGDDYAAGDGLAGATNLRKLLALAEREAWRLAAGRSAGEFDFSSAGTSESRSQLHKQITAPGGPLARAEALVDDLGYDAVGSGRVTITAIRDDGPYVYLPDELRVRY